MVSAMYVYSDWVRQKGFDSVAFNPVWQHVKMSKQIHIAYTTKQPKLFTLSFGDTVGHYQLSLGLFRTTSSDAGDSCTKT